MMVIKHGYMDIVELLNVKEKDSIV